MSNFQPANKKGGRTLVPPPPAPTPKPKEPEAPPSNKTED